MDSGDACRAKRTRGRMATAALLRPPLVPGPLGSDRRRAGRSVEPFWPRDGSFAAVALARSDHASEARGVLEALSSLAFDPHVGFEARYELDGSAKADRPAQSDGCGWVLWAIGAVREDARGGGESRCGLVATTGAWGRWSALVDGRTTPAAALARLLGGARPGHQPGNGGPDGARARTRRSGLPGHRRVGSRPRHRRGRGRPARPRRRSLRPATTSGSATPEVWTLPPPCCCQPFTAPGRLDRPVAKDLTSCRAGLRPARAAAGRRSGAGHPVGHARWHVLDAPDGAARAVRRCGRRPRRGGGVAGLA